MIRYATRQDIPDVNRLRAQVGEMHAEALPDLFKPGFPQPLQDYAYHMLESENTEILVCERDGAIRGFAVVEYCRKEETPAHPAQEICYIHEFGVDRASRRQGIARELMTFIRGRPQRRAIGIWNWTCGNSIRARWPFTRLWAFAPSADTCP